MKGGNGNQTTMLSYILSAATPPEDGEELFTVSDAEYQMNQETFWDDFWGAHPELTNLYLLIDETM